MEQPGVQPNVLHAALIDRLVFVPVGDVNQEFFFVLLSCVILHLRNDP